MHVLGSWSIKALKFSIGTASGMEFSDLGDEISFKKRYKPHVTLMTDPESPKVLAVARGKDTAAAKK